MLDFQIQCTLDTITFEEQLLSVKTLSRFHKRCYDYNDSTEYDKFVGCLSEHTIAENEN